MKKYLSIAIYCCILFIASNASDMQRKIVKWNDDKIGNNGHTSSPTHTIRIGLRKAEIYDYDYLYIFRKYVNNRKYNYDNEIHINLRDLFYDYDRNFDSKIFFNETKRLDTFKTSSAFNFPFSGKRCLTLDDFGVIVNAFLEKGMIKKEPLTSKEYALEKILSYENNGFIFKYLQEVIIDRLKSIFSKNISSLKDTSGRVLRYNGTLNTENYNFSDAVLDIRSFLNNIKIIIKENNLFDDYIKYGKDLSKKDLNDGDKQDIFKMIVKEQEKIINTIIKKFVDESFNKETYVLLIKKADEMLQETQRKIAHCEEQKIIIQNKINDAKKEDSVDVLLKEQEENKKRHIELQKELDSIKKIVELKEQFDRYNPNSLNQQIKNEIYNNFRVYTIEDILRKFIYRRLEYPNEQYFHRQLNDEVQLNQIFSNEFNKLRVLVDREELYFGSKQFIFQIKRLCLEIAKKAYASSVKFKQLKVSEQKVADFIYDSLSGLIISKYIFSRRLSNAGICGLGLDDHNKKEDIPPILTEHYSDNISCISILHKSKSPSITKEDLIRYIQYLLYNVIKSINEKKEELSNTCIVIHAPRALDSEKEAANATRIIMEEVFDVAYFVNFPKNVKIVFLSDFIPNEKRQDFVANVNYILNETDKEAQETGKNPVIFSALHEKESLKIRTDRGSFSENFFMRLDDMADNVFNYFRPQ